jgi:thiamine biosynthesis lipoprotein
VNAEQWTVWSTTARVVVTEPKTLPTARALVERLLAEIDQACSRFRPDSELMAAGRSSGPVQVSPLLATLVEVALRAAEESDGVVDPTVGGALQALGYERDISIVDVDGLEITLKIKQSPGWRSVKLAGNTLTTAALVLGDDALAMLREHDVPARLVAADGTVRTLGGWP